MVELSEDTSVTIPLRNLIALVVATAVAVLGYSELNSRLTTLEHGQSIQDMTIRENAAFVREWPLGERGALPDDLIQNANIAALERRQDDFEEYRDRINELQIEINKVNGHSETQAQKIESLFDLWNSQLAERVAN